MATVTPPALWAAATRVRLAGATGCSLEGATQCLDDNAAGERLARCTGSVARACMRRATGARLMTCH